MTKNHRRVKFGCYMNNVCMAVYGNVPALLFLTFRSLYGISYTLLGLLILVHFSTQLIVDLIFSFFSKKFNIKLTVKLTPVITVIGSVIFALAPFLFPNNVFLGLVLGSIAYSTSAGLSEVLMSSTIAAIPSENPEREMSRLHSIYAWGVVIIVIFSTVFIKLFGGEAWQILIAILTLIPIVTVIAFISTDIPVLEDGAHEESREKRRIRFRELFVCVFAIFLGGASECTMAQWCSSYAEKALGIDKVLGDVFGTAFFALMLAIGRTLYAKVGKNIERMLLFGSIGAALCYILATVSKISFVGLTACGITGLCVSMLWPGSLIVSSKRIPNSGVFIYAMMAAGGDLGASLSPQLVGIVTDKISASQSIVALAERLGLTTEQFGMKFGLGVATIFPILSALLYIYILKTSKRHDTQLAE